MSEKDKQGQDELEEKKKKLDERFEKLRLSVLGLGESLDDSQKHGEQSPEEQKKRAAERMEKLRKLSFNIKATPLGNKDASDPNDFDNVPAYIRRNMELQNNESDGPFEDILDEKEIVGRYSEEEDTFLFQYRHLSLYFPLNDFDEEEITEIISLLSDLYRSIGGDELQIKSIKTFEFVNQLTPEFV